MNDKILQILAETFECEINADSSSENTPNWDSLNHVRMILELQQNFGVKISHDKIAELNSVKKISEFLQDKIN